jgi:hypothetical protein
MLGASRNRISLGYWAGGLTLAVFAFPLAIASGLVLSLVVREVLSHTVVDLSLVVPIVGPLVVALLLVVLVVPAAVFRSTLDARSEVSNMLLDDADAALPIT